MAKWVHIKMEKTGSTWSNEYTSRWRRQGQHGQMGTHQDGGDRVDMAKWVHIKVEETGKTWPHEYTSRWRRQGRHDHMRYTSRWRRRGRYGHMSTHQDEKLPFLKLYSLLQLLMSTTFFCSLYLTYPPHLTLLTIPFYSRDSIVFLAFLALLCLGFSQTSLIELSRLCQLCFLRSCGLKHRCPTGVNASSYSLCPFQSFYFWNCMLSLSFTPQFLWWQPTVQVWQRSSSSWNHWFSSVLNFGCKSLDGKQSTVIKQSLKQKWFWLQKTSFNSDSFPQSINLEGSDIQLANTNRKLGACVDPTLSFQQQISVCRICYLELRRISAIRHYLSEDVTKNLLCAFILSRLE